MTRGLLIGAGTAVAAVAAVGVGVYEAGRRLPVEHLVERSLRVAQAPHAVWEVLSDIDLYPAWRPGLTHIERLPVEGGRIRWREYERHGAMTYEVVESVEPSRLVTRIADDRGLPFGGTWTYAIDPAEGGCTVTVTERGEIYRPVYRFVSRYVRGQAATIDRHLGALAAHLGGSRNG
ncbi:SRPBCC domain-containing protein [Kitasatospora sp. NPDC050543]|uniref:SRPBCC domain-containing protein n=1 Tax=Kitasatospora sp. NPDC050543 TaxID=3364054 RepID=UPI00379E7D71